MRSQCARECVCVCADHVQNRAKPLRGQGAGSLTLRPLVSLPHLGAPTGSRGPTAHSSMCASLLSLSKARRTICPTASCPALFPHWLRSSEPCLGVLIPTAAKLSLSSCPAAPATPCPCPCPCPCPTIQMCWNSGPVLPLCALTHALLLIINITIILILY